MVRTTLISCTGGPPQLNGVVVTAASDDNDRLPTGIRPIACRAALSVSITLGDGRLAAAPDDTPIGEKSVQDRATRSLGSARQRGFIGYGRLWRRARAVRPSAPWRSKTPGEGTRARAPLAAPAVPCGARLEASRKLDCRRFASTRGRCRTT